MSVDQLNEVARNAVEEYLRSDAAVKKIAETVQKTTDRAIEETLSSYSDFGKQVKAAVSKSLAIHGKIELPEYNHMLLNMIAVHVEHATKDSIQRQVAERMKDLLEPAPAEIKLSELIEQYREFLKDRANSGCSCDSRHEFYFKVEDEDDDFFRRIALSESKPERHLSADIRFGLSRGARPRGETPFVGEIYTLSFRENQEIERKMFVGPLYGFQRSLFQMQAAKTAIIVDVYASDVDTSYGDHD